MKINNFLILLIGTILLSCHVTREDVNNELQFISLLCEYQENPLGIDNPAPRLTWKLRSDRRNGAQSAYQILVSEDKNQLAANRGEIWDSDKIISGNSVNVEYMGRQLRSGVRYYWKVRVWDENGMVSNYSPIAYWEMGLLNREDWSARWISAPRVFNWSKRDQLRKTIEKDAPPIREEPAPLFRKNIRFDKNMKSARVYISGLGYHELYINGQKVGDAVLDPAFTDYTSTVLYRTHDVTGHLSDGINTIGIMLGNGWYNMFTRAVWSFDKSPWIADPALKLQMEIRYEDGTGETYVSDSSWKCAPGPVIFNSIRQGETYDARQEKKGWLLSEYDDSDWEQVRIVRGPEGSMRAQSMPPIRITKRLTPEKVTQIKDDTWVFDFGQNIAGFAELSIAAPAGTRISLKYGEKLYPDGRVDQSNIDGLVAEGPFQTDQYITRGEGIETWHPRFVYHGFRYVEVSGSPEPLKPENLNACVAHTAFKKKGILTTSNPVLNRIQQNTEWSFVNNFHGYPTDCPHREKNGWTGDAQLASEMALFNFHVENAYDKWVQDILDVQLESGMVPAIVPTGGWGYEWGNGPAWDYALLAIPWKTYIYSGDRQILEKYYPAMVLYMSFLSSTAENHIVRWGLGDWVPIRTTTPSELITTAYYYQDAVLMSKIAGVLGVQKDVTFYETLAGEIRQAFRNEFVDEDMGVIGNGSQSSLGCALYFSLLDSQQMKIYAHKLVDIIEDSDLNLDFGVLGAKFVPNALAENGHKQKAYNMITTDDFPGWGNWISRGATTLWEDWKGESSLNHVFFGDVSAWFYKYLAGLQPDEFQPGFRHFFVRPFFVDGLDSVQAELETPSGKIVSQWKRKEKGVELEIEIPFNSLATVEFESKGSVTLIDKMTDEEIDFEEKSEAGNFFSGKLGSGNYRIILKNP